MSKRSLYGNIGESVFQTDSDNITFIVQGEQVLQINNNEVKMPVYTDDGLLRVVSGDVSVDQTIDGDISNLQADVSNNTSNVNFLLSNALTNTDPLTLIPSPFGFGQVGINTSTGLIRALTVNNGGAFIREELGVGISRDPAAVLEVTDQSSTNLTDTSELRDYQLNIGRNGIASGGEGAGIAFTISSGAFPENYPNGYGASSSFATLSPLCAITASRRTDGFYGGNLHFKTRITSGAFEPCETRMTITNTGNVGIGLSNPTARLHLDTKFKDAEHLVIRCSPPFETPDDIFTVRDVNSSGVVDMENRFGNKTVQLHTEGSSYLNGGNVGIGTTAPSNTLHVVGSMRANKALIQDHATLDRMTIRHNSVSGSGSYCLAQNELGDCILNAGTNRSIFMTINEFSSLIPLRVDSAGRIAINHASSHSPHGVLDVNGGIFFNRLVTGRNNVGDAAMAADLSVILNANNQVGGIRLSTNGAVSTSSYRFADWLLRSDGSGNFRTCLRVNNNATMSSTEAISVRLNTGNVGIGTENPTDKLHVIGGLRLQGSLFLTNNVTNLTIGSSTTLQNKILIEASASTDRFIRFRRGGSSPAGYAGLQFSDFDSHSFYTNAYNGSFRIAYAAGNPTTVGSVGSDILRINNNGSTDITGDLSVGGTLGTQGHLTSFTATILTGSSFCSLRAERRMMYTAYDGKTVHYSGFLEFEWTSAINTLRLIGVRIATPVGTCVSSRNYGVAVPCNINSANYNNFNIFQYETAVNGSVHEIWIAFYINITTTGDFRINFNGMYEQV